MKKLSLSEVALVCAPLVLIAAGAVVFSARQNLNPPRDPNARIVLSVAPDPGFAGKAAKDGIVFARTIKASNSPKEGIDIYSNERIVATGHGHSQVVYNTSFSTLSAMESGWYINSGGVGSDARGSSSSVRIAGDLSRLPVWTSQLNWHGEIVAVPNKVSFSSRYFPAPKIRQIASTPGATYLAKQLPVSVKADALDPIQKFQLIPIPSDYEAYKMDIGVKMEFKNSKSKMFRQLVAFDGKTRRVLWSEGDAVDSPRGFSGQYHSSSPIQASDVMVFKLRDVPRSWGEITLLLDIVFDPRLNPGIDWKSCDKATIQKLKSRGWLAFSRRLVVRPAV